MKSPISRFTVSGNSMLPALHPGQDVISFNWSYVGRKPQVGDMVVIKVNGKEMVKRVQSVDASKVFVEGDHKTESTDSRHFGAVGMDQIIGQVVYVSEAEESSAYQSHPDLVDCPRCNSQVIGIYGRKDAICQNCGFKLTCCGEP